MLFLEVFSEIGEAELVAVLEIAVGGVVFLNRVVCQVHPIIVQRGRVRRILARACANVALLEKEAVEALGHQHPAADVEFTTLYKQGILDVLLDNELRALYQILVLLRIIVLHSLFWTATGFF